jgi:hypothetical protein
VDFQAALFPKQRLMFQSGINLMSMLSQIGIMPRQRGSASAPSDRGEVVLVLKLLTDSKRRIETLTHRQMAQVSLRGAFGLEFALWGIVGEVKQKG